MPQARACSRNKTMGIRAIGVSVSIAGQTVLIIIRKPSGDVVEAMYAEIGP